MTMTGGPALGKDGREDGGRRGFAYAALGRADRNNGHLLEPRRCAHKKERDAGEP